MALTLPRKLLQAMHQFNLCTRNDCLIAGVSGGADSVALLDLLATLPDFPLKLVVAHLNHQLRGAESDADEYFVQELAAGYQLPCEVRRSNIRQLAQQRQMSLEEAGRLARYGFFQELRQRYHAAAIAVAHHADDQAETFLLRLLRGAGTTGLSAMAPVNRAGIIRPLLEVTRQELRGYLQDRNLSFREDTSNTDCSYLRNRIRHELLPVLQDYNPAISQRLAATASLLGEDEALLAHCTDTAFRQYSRCGAGWTALSLQDLKQQPRPLRLRLFRKAIEGIAGNLQRFALRHHQLLDELLQRGKTGNKLDLPGTMVAVVTSDHLLFAQKNYLQPPPPSRCTIEGPGVYELGNGLTLCVELTSVPGTWKSVPVITTYINPDSAPFPWQVRPVVPGERIELLGMAGSRSIQDILTDLKFPSHLRQALPLISYGDQPLWLAGIRRSRHGLVRPELNYAIRISLAGTEKLPLFPGPSCPCS